jgi:hypothetical protein
VIRVAALAGPRLCRLMAYWYCVGGKHTDQLFAFDGVPRSYSHRSLDEDIVSSKTRYLILLQSLRDGAAALVETIRVCTDRGPPSSIQGPTLNPAHGALAMKARGYLGGLATWHNYTVTPHIRQHPRWSPLTTALSGTAGTPFFKLYRTLRALDPVNCYEPAIYIFSRR